MSFERVFPAGSMSAFKQRLADRLLTLATETRATDFIMPVGMVLVLDEANGGNATAQELTRRFNLLDFESRNVVDFYFLGWSPDSRNPSEKAIRFDLKAFEACREALRAVGLREFGGNADLILVDAILRDRHVTLDFTTAMCINLAAGVDQKLFVNLGAFLQAIVDASEDIRKAGTAPSSQGAVFAISDKLGLATAKRSFLEFIFEKWGKIIGANKLAALTVRNIGPRTALARL